MSYLEDRSWAAFFYDDVETYRAHIDDLTVHLKINPSNVAALNNRAVMYWEIGESEAAEADFELATAFATVDHLPFSNWGRMLANNGETERALELYKRGLQINGRDSALNASMAHLLVELSRDCEAIPYFSRAIRARRTFRQFYVDRALARRKCGQAVRARIDEMLASVL